LKIEDITFDVYKKAINIYLNIAYPNGVKEYNFCYKIIKSLREALTLKEITSIFEEQKISMDIDFEIRRYIVRLGSEKYPFIKLVLQEAEVSGDFGFYVDRHTEYLALASSSKSFDEEKKIKEYTKGLKQRIEEEYDKQRIPTYKQIIKKFTQRLSNIKTSIEINKNGIKVLLVDDDKDVLELDKLSLEILGYTVSIAENGEEAICKVKHESNDIMMLDMLMPTISGFEVINRVSKDIPIIVLSSLSDEMSKKICLDGGAKAIITKPVETYILDDYIKKVLKEDK
jgi:CheY-like chemotaxis protein